MGGRVAIEWFLMRAFAADSSSPPKAVRVLFKDHCNDVNALHPCITRF